jgi:cell division protein FtsZ
MSGARGVLVNITAGLDMSIGEFEEVGEAIKSITSEGATVVVGTVIDPELRDEVRVTVIVTGLGRKQAPGSSSIANAGTSTKVFDPTVSSSVIDYHHLDKPAVLRRQGASFSPATLAAPAPSVATPAQAKPAAVVDVAVDMDYLDIPAFLRRKEEVETT